MRKPAEHGNTFTSVIFGVSSVILAIMIRRDFYSVIFWIPIWIGLFLYDIPLKRVLRSIQDTLWLGLIILISLVAIYIDVFLLVPYLIFFSVYGLRNYLVSKRVNFAGTALGILAFTVLFVETIGLSGYSSLFLATSIFVYMIGSEFTVRARLKKNKWLLVYDVLPASLFILNPVFLVFSLSVIRIPVALKSKDLKLVGMTEAILLLTVTVFISLFYVIKL